MYLIIFTYFLNAIGEIPVNFGFDKKYRIIRLNGGLVGHLAQPPYQNGVNTEFRPRWLEICPVQFLKPLRMETPQSLQTTTSTAWLSSQ